MRTPHGKFAEYHSSADNLDFVRADALRDTLEKAIATVDVIENNGYHLNQKPFCEPKLGDYGLYSAMGGLSPPDYQMALLWVLNMSDGHNSLLDIGEKSKLPWAMVKQAVAALTEAGLLRPIEPELAREGRIPRLAGSA
jgi:aminopeptidase-like protein